MESVTLAQLAYIGEIISGLAVATTLVVLVFEMSAGNRRLHSEALRETVNDFIRSFSQATESTGAAANFRNGLNNFIGMQPDDQALFHSTMLNLSGGFSQVLSLYEKGLLEGAPFEAAQRVYLTTMRTPSARQWWSSFKHIPPVPFVEYVDLAVSDPGIDIGSAHNDLPWLKKND